MAHANARLTFHGRCLLVRRVVLDGRPVAHVAKEVGVSRQCAHHWVNRYRAEGWAGLHDRSSRPHRCPHRTPAAAEQRVLTARQELRCGPDGLAEHTGVPARTVSRILRRHRVPPLSACDPLTGQVIRATRSSAERYEHARPGDMIHLDVKKLGKIPDGGGHRVHGRGERPGALRGLGYDYVHAAVDDHSRLAYAEILTNEKGTTCAGFLTRAAEFFRAHGITRIERVMTDNAKNYRISHDFQAACQSLGARQKFTRPHCPWTNGKVERFNRTLQTEWAYRQVFTSNDQRQPHSRPGSPSTTLAADTPRSAASPRSLVCHQPHDRIQLEPLGRAPPGRWSARGSARRERDGHSGRLSCARGAR